MDSHMERNMCHFLSIALHMDLMYECKHQLNTRVSHIEQKK